MKCNKWRPGFELVSPCPFPATITITLRAPPFFYWYSFGIKSHTKVDMPSNNVTKPNLGIQYSYSSRFSNCRGIFHMMALSRRRRMHCLKQKSKTSPQKRVVNLTASDCEALGILEKLLPLLLAPLCPEVVALVRVLSMGWIYFFKNIPIQSGRVLKNLSRNIYTKNVNMNSIPLLISIKQS